MILLVKSEIPRGNYNKQQQINENVKHQCLDFIIVAIFDVSVVLIRDWSEIIKRLQRNV